VLKPTVIVSVSDPFHFDTDPDLLIRFVENPIRPKMEKNNVLYNFFILITKKMLLRYFMNL